MVTEELDTQPGEWLLQTAAGSTLGRVVLQLAKLRGFKTINVVRRREQVEELKSLGADEVICTADEDLVARVREITGGSGVMKAIDAVGGATGAGVASALGRGGVVLVYGLLSMQPMPVDSGRMIFTTTTIRGFWLSQWMQAAPPARVYAVTMELMKLMATDKVVPPVEAEYQLTDALAAVERAAGSGKSGKVLLIS